MKKRILLAQYGLGHYRDLPDRLREGGCSVNDAATDAGGPGVLHAMPFDLAVLGLRPAVREDCALLERMLGAAPSTPVICLVPHASLEYVLHLFRLGACDVLVGPFQPAFLIDRIRSILAAGGRNLDLSRMRREARRLPGPRVWLEGKSPMYRGIIAQLKDAAIRSPPCTLLTGEPGTGKRVAARLLHCWSPRRPGPWVEWDLATAGPGRKIRSRRFRTIGDAVAAAAGGTLLLTHLECLSSAGQRELRTWLETAATPTAPEPPSPRARTAVVCSSCPDPTARNRGGRPREEWWRQLAAAQIRLPPLRSYTHDFPPLVDHFIGRLSEQLRKPVCGVDSETMGLLISHHWQGNLRELACVIEHGVLMCESEWLTVPDLPPYLIASHPRDRVDDRREAAGTGRRPRRAPPRGPVAPGCSMPEDRGTRPWDP